MQTILDEQQMKDMMKAAFIEVLQERRDLLRDVVAETLEDIALSRAIAEGEAEGGTVRRAEIFALLRGEGLQNRGDEASWRHGGN